MGYVTNDLTQAKWTADEEAARTESHWAVLEYPADPPFRRRAKYETEFLPTALFMARHLDAYCTVIYRTDTNEKGDGHGR